MFASPNGLWILGHRFRQQWIQCSVVKYSIIQLYSATVCCSAVLQSWSCTVHYHTNVAEQSAALSPALANDSTASMGTTLLLPSVLFTGM